MKQKSETLVLLQDNTRYETRDGKEFRVSGHRVELGRDRYQIIMRIDGLNQYHKNFESALKHLRLAIGEYEDSVKTIADIVEFERKAWAEVAEIAKKIDKEVKPIWSSGNV